MFGLIELKSGTLFIVLKMAVRHYQFFFSVEIIFDQLMFVKQMNLKFHQYEQLALNLILVLVSIFLFPYVITFFRSDRYILQSFCKVYKIYTLFIQIFIFWDMKRKFLFTSFVTTYAVDYYKFINHNGFL